MEMMSAPLCTRDAWERWVYRGDGTDQAKFAAIVGSLVEHDFQGIAVGRARWAWWHSDERIWMTATVNWDQTQPSHGRHVLPLTPQEVEHRLYVNRVINIVRGDGGVRGFGLRVHGSFREDGKVDACALTLSLLAS
jgi:hypothetical protein